MKAVCVYCGSSQGSQPWFMELARTTGRLLAERGCTVVYGGGAVGLMGAVADAALAAGGRVVGIIPEKLMQREVGHTGLTQLQVVPDMHTRKRLMAEQADAFIALPGGLGTFEELFEVWTWRQLGYHNKPIGILNSRGYYDHLLQFLKHTVASGFVRQAQFDFVTIASTIEELLERLAAESAQISATKNDLSAI